jgi:hypothetical protein
MPGFSESFADCSIAKTHKVEGSEFCSLCGESENVDHLLFANPLAKFIWVFVKQALGWADYPRDMEDLMTTWLPGKFKVSYQTGLSCFAGIEWAIWNTRNKITIQKQFPAKAVDAVHLAMSFLQKWRNLMKAIEKTKVEKLVAAMLQRTEEFQPSAIQLSDVGFI